MHNPPVVVLVAAGLLAACSPDVIQAPEAGPPAAIRKIRGDLQRADPGVTLASQLSIEVSDSAGVPVRGAPIAWRFRSGSGQLEPLTAATDAAGKASTTVHLGSTVRDIVEVEAQVTSDSSLRTVFWVLIGDAAFGPPPVTVDASVRVGDGYFRPLSVSIPVGGRVIWTLEGAQPHFITMEAGNTSVRIHSGTPNLSGSGSYIAVFPDSGTFTFRCGFHWDTEPRGTVHVR